MSMADCSLCSPQLGPVLSKSEHWRLVLNVNQNLLGKCMLVLRRHLEVTPQLTPAEWMDLHAQIRHVHAALSAALQPDHFNYAFLQNQDRHVHLHVIPRYGAPRTLGGAQFDDPDYPGHYAPSNSPRRLSDPAMAALADLLRPHLLPPGG